MTSKHWVRAVVFFGGTAWVLLVGLSCSSGVVGIPTDLRTPAVIEGKRDLTGPPLWATPGERRRKVKPNTDTMDPRLAAFREESPIKYGFAGNERLARFLFYFTETPGWSVEESVADAFDLPRKAADLAVEATFGQNVAWNEHTLGDAVSPRYAESERAYWEAIDIAPRAWVLYESLAKLYSASPNRCDMGGIERVSQRWGNRREALLRLAPIVIGSDECEALDHVLLSDYPADIEVLGLLARRFDSNWHDAGFGLALRRHALELAFERDTPEPLRLTIDRGLIHGMLSSGRSREGLALWESRAEQDRARMLERPNEFEGLFPSGFRGIIGQIDEALALELSAAYVVAGRDDVARSLMPRVPKTSPPSEDRGLLYRHSRRQACHGLLEAALGEHIADPFEFLLKLAGGGNMFGDNADTCHHNDTWIQLSRHIALKAGYPRFESEFGEDEDNPFETSSFEYFEENDTGFLAAASMRLREEYMAVRKEFEVEDAEGEAVSLPNQVQRLVDARFDLAFRESGAVDIEGLYPPSEQAMEWIAEAARGDTTDTTPPTDVVRTDRQGEIVVRVHLNQDVDPMGEVGGGSYWLSFSADRGARWTGRFFTGLRAGFPYVIEAESEIPILSGGTVRIAAEVDEIDPSTISFPPIGLGSKRRTPNRLLSVPLTTLTRDRDSDGLTDLLEHALLLDPDNADSDQDGLPDGFDALPRTPYRPGVASARAEVLQAAIPHLFGSGLHARVVAPLTAADFEGDGDGDGDGMERAMGSPVGQGSERTLFVVGEHADFSALSVAGRVVVLSAEESRAIGERAGVFYPVSIGLFVLDHDERRGYLGWGGGWTGGALGFKRILGRWTVEVLSHWMT